MALPRGIRIVAQPLLAEVVHADCDVGRRASLLQAEFPRVSFSLVANHWFLNDAFVDMSADEEPLVADDAWCVDGCPFRPKGALANGTISRVERESEANIAERARCFRRVRRRIILSFIPFCTMDDIVIATHFKLYSILFSGLTAQATVT